MNILITGGVSCGKSSFAENFLLSFDTPHYYVATMKHLDQESEIKINKHIKRREGTDIIVFEKESDLNELEFPEKGSVLLECLTTLTANVFFNKETDMYNEANHIFDMVVDLSKKSENLIIVTNEVGCSYSTEYTELTEAYLEEFGRLNCLLANYCDCVVEMSSGIPSLLKGCISNV